MATAMFDRLSVVLALRNNPAIFQWYGRRRERDLFNRRVLRNGDDAVIDGFPRSGNTFATHAFLAAQGEGIKIGNHCHTPAQFFLAKRYRIPAMLLLRKPSDAIMSYMLFARGMGAREAFRRYISFHRPLLELREHFVVAPFEEVVSDFDSSIQRLNRRFGTNFALINHTVERAQQVIAEIEGLRQQRIARYADHPNDALKRTTPTAEKDRARMALKGNVNAPDLRVLADEAYALHNVLARDTK